MAHVVFLPDWTPDFSDRTGPPILISGPEAHHAVRVKRLVEGDALHMHDGRGGVGHARIERIEKSRRGEWQVHAALTAPARRLPPLDPCVHVLTCAPKGEHLEQMIDGLSQAGAASWSPLHSRRSIVDPRPGKLERLRRVAEESLKQCGRAWLMDVADRALELQDVLRERGPDCILADASGAPFLPADHEAPPAGGPRALTLLIGPEGGWSPEEVALATHGGARVHRFGPHVMRIEVAAVVATAMVIAEFQPRSR